MTVLHGSLTLFCVTCLAAPAIGSAQALITPTPLPVATPPPVRLFNETLVESSLSPVTIESANWWEPPTIGSDMPRWRIGYTVKLNTASGFALSAGVSGRKGDPFPLYRRKASRSAWPRKLNGSPGATGPVGREIRCHRALAKYSTTEHRRDRRSDCATYALDLPLGQVSDVTRPQIRGRDGLLIASRSSGIRAHP